PAWTQIYESERVTLRCQVQGDYTDLRLPLQYSFMKDGSVIETSENHQYNIETSNMAQTGLYKCAIQMQGVTKESEELKIEIKKGRPKPVLTRVPAGEIFEEDSVTLSCVVEGGSDGWRYLWYKDRQAAPVYQTDSSSGTGAGYTISAAALPHSGEYWCGAGRGRNTFYSEHSDPVWVNVTGE
ncbi:high affinity immunoglobulin gamma Fc receptor IB-like, partial [Acipenser oxyrinchus oxyrinchus]